MKRDMNKIEVSVVCTVYNHEAFLHKCLDGFVSQKTNFAFEVLVHDDASTDSSKDIILDYAKKYPDIIVPIIQSENQHSKGIQAVDDVLLPMAKGKYIAFCEGDDYWCNEEKLQKQYDYMEAHPEASICLHNTIKHDLSGGVKDQTFNKWTDVHKLTERDVFFGWTVHLTSYFMKKELVKNPEFAKEYWFGDYKRLAWAYAFGEAVCLPDIMSVYNWANQEGITQKMINASVDTFIAKTKARAEYLREYNEHTDYRFDAIIQERIMHIDFECVRAKNVAIIKNSKDKDEIIKAATEIHTHPYFKTAIKRRNKIKQFKEWIKYKGCYCYPIWHYYFMHFC